MAGDRPVRVELLEALLACGRDRCRGVVDQPVLREVLERRGLQVLEEARGRRAKRGGPLRAEAACCVLASATTCAGLPVPVSAPASTVAYTLPERQISE
jgi:hypothetical protein